MNQNRRLRARRQKQGRTEYSRSCPALPENSSRSIFHQILK
ncbi:hypothetical protein CLOSTASPAR_03085 [[Clostridium] asparagiforme DSM 15981]|uniref:Uncharacterized protein n=1 Tax=[Clostridium] asparagiforme DSM 15981 TaxID=518636 RepID=C0D1E7_9FIRM|nr:hypothetical protein CLOSTASPAR_03085 [[Clostridium] asparagiforme DSM 15981]